MKTGHTSCLMLVLFVMQLVPTIAAAHCDALDGPVVNAAQRALATGNVNHALAWVQREAEPEIKLAFAKTLAVRKLNGGAQDLADRYFFETLVRLHRAGEGEPYTGLKPAGRGVGPVVEAVDKSIDGGSSEPIMLLLWEAVRVGVEGRFAEVSTARASDTDVGAMRRQVQAYVGLIHYVERLYEQAIAGAGDVRGLGHGIDDHARGNERHVAPPAPNAGR
jgi:hypothetical protein